MKRVLFALVLVIASALPAHAQEAVTDDFSEGYYPQHYRVSLDGVSVSDDALVYVSDDETVYVSAADLDAWGLKRPLSSAFEREGRSYYGLQSDLNLAASYDNDTRELVIVADKSAFRGEPAPRPTSLADEHGAFLNYELNRETSKYDFAAVSPAGELQMRFLSTDQDGLEFHRGRTRWLHVNPAAHYVLGLGEATADGGWLGVNTPFAGIHYATDYSSDPEYASGPPSVTGFATSPSLLEVYIDNVLELRRDVPQGPFSVRDLPQSAARADIVLVLTDQAGKQTTQVVRPAYAPNFLGPGRSELVFDAGIGHENAGLRNQFYRGGVAQGKFRYGISSRLTAELYGESVNGTNFADGGFDLSLGPAQTLGIRIGGGNRRHASEYRYEFEGGKLRVKETLRLDSAANQPLPDLDFQNADENIAERTQIDWTFNRRWSAGLDFHRYRSNTGSNTETIASKVTYRSGRFTLSLAPFYDFVRARTSANLSLVFQLAPDRRAGLDSGVSATGQTSAALDLRKTASPDDPLAMRVKISANRSQDRRFEIADDFSWGTASFVWQQQFGRSLYEPSILGALAFVGFRPYPTPPIGEKEAIGVLHLPGYRNVRVSVNSEGAGTTDSTGTLVLRNLSTYHDNTVTITTADLPISVNVTSPVHVVPPMAAPVDIAIPVLSRGGFAMRVVDDTGSPLPAAGYLTTGAAKYPVGYDGRVFISGVQPGPLALSGKGARAACMVNLTVPATIAQIPDLGTQVCRATKS
jgi:outer membrane usher protein